MTINNDKTHFQREWPWWRWVIMGLNTFALVLSIILSWHFLKGGSMVGCDGGSPCDQVLSSRWAMIAGVLPVSGLAAGAYFAMFIAGLFMGPATEVTIRRMAWSAMLVIAGSVAGSAIWFTIIQKWIIGDFCIYCMTTHITGLLLATLVIWRSIREFNNNSKENALSIHSENQDISTKPRKRILGLSLIGLFLAGSLVIFQIIFKPKTVYHDGNSKEMLPEMDYNDAPMIGSPNAPYIVTLLFDYQCSHCQKLHFMLDEVIQKYEGKLAFVLCPAPLSRQCNQYIPNEVEAFKNSCELAKIALAVWFVNREAFSTFENWMFTFETGDRWHPRSPEAAREKAIELVGQTKFDAAWFDPWTEQYIQTSIQIYGQTIQTGKRGVPKLLFEGRWVIPEAQNADELILILQNSLDLPII